MHDHPYTVIQSILEYVAANQVERQCGKHVNKHTAESLSPSDIASFSKLTPSRCKQLFKQTLGVELEQFLQTKTKLVAAQQLESNPAIFQDNGSRANRTFPGGQKINFIETMKTEKQRSTTRTKEPLWWDRFWTPLGGATLAATPQGLRTLWFDSSSSDASKKELQIRNPQSIVIQDRARVAPYFQYVLQSMAGERPQEQLSIDLQGTAFQLRTWGALMQIPPKSVLSYRKVAELVGTPRATQAVGSAIGANPIAYIIPCHRVIKSNGDIGEYRWGHIKKYLMLNLEFAREAR